MKPILLLSLLTPSVLYAIEPYSTATVAYIDGGIFDRAVSITNPSGVKADGVTIGYGTVGGNDPGSRKFLQMSAFRVSDLLTELGASDLADLANITFDYQGITEASPTDIDDASIYQVAYAGQWEDTGENYTNVPLRGTDQNEGIENMGGTPTTTNDNRTLFCDAGDAIAGYTAFGGPGIPMQTVDTGIFDLAGTSQTITGTGFDLSHLATDLADDVDLSDNYVFFSIFLSPQAPSGLSAQNFDAVMLLPNGAPGAIGFGITEIIYDSTANTVMLTWTSRPNTLYSAKYSMNMADGWDPDLGDSLGSDDDENPNDGDKITVTFNIPAPLVENEDTLFFRIEKE